MIYLSLDDILEIHKQVIHVFGGSDGIRDIGRLESVVAAQTQDVFGLELHSTIIEKASVVMRGLVQDHPFLDGNKRTAVVASVSLIKCNGINFTAKKGELEDFTVQVAVERLTVNEIASWFKLHCL